MPQNLLERDTRQRLRSQSVLHSPLVASDVPISYGAIGDCAMGGGECNLPTINFRQLEVPHSQANPPRAPRRSSSVVS
eukprot:scaffold65303_cov28-Tisochrysis_lutea.AAC.2